MDHQTGEVYLAGLLALWGERDSRYFGHRKRKLSKVEIEAITTWRRREAMRLCEPERGLALQVIREWPE